MELDRVEAALGRGDGGVFGVVGRGDGAKAFRELGEAVAVAHPDAEFFAGREGGEDADGVVHAHAGRAVFALLARLDFAAELVGHELLAVADAEHRDAEGEYAGVALR